MLHRLLWVERPAIFVVLSALVMLSAAPVQAAVRSPERPPIAGVQILANSENSQTSDEPEYVGIFAARDPKSGHYIRLERRAPERVTKTRVLGYGGGEMHLRFSGEKSPVRFKSGQPLEFVVRVAAQDEDPQSFVLFYSLESKKGQRILPTYNVGIFMIGSRERTNDHAVHFTAVKFGSHFFRVLPQQSLAPGEYFFTVGADQSLGSSLHDGFCFGIDP